MADTLEHAVVVSDEVLPCIRIYRVTNLNREHEGKKRNLKRALELTRPVDVLSSLLGNEVAVAGAKYEDCAICESKKIP